MIYKEEDILEGYFMLLKKHCTINHEYRFKNTLKDFLKAIQKRQAVELIVKLKQLNPDITTLDFL